jgi:hypothetical protein
MHGFDDMHDPDLIPLILMDEEEERRQTNGPGIGPASGCCCALPVLVSLVVALGVVLSFAGT